jgi:hypothetical protein
MAPGEEAYGDRLAGVVAAGADCCVDVVVSVEAHEASRNSEQIERSRAKTDSRIFIGYGRDVETEAELLGRMQTIIPAEGKAKGVMGAGVRVTRLGPGALCA